MSLAASVTPQGVSAPTLEDILASNQGMMRGIYGSDIYIDPDSQDGQQIGVWSTALNDVNNMFKAVYAAFSPASAQGAGLSNVVKINGLRRNVSSYSTSDLDCVGQQGTDVSGLIIGDNLGLNTTWQLPGTPGSETVVIPEAGTITATATCLQPGAIAAAPGSLTKMITPTRNWQSVTNSAAATPGAPVEVDAQLRQRQSVSTAGPALSVLGSTWAAIGNVSGVTKFTIEENDTDTTDANGVPSHSIAPIVQGGDDMAIAGAVALKKGPGCGTYGTTSITVPDPAGVGVPEIINFYRLSVQQISALIYLTPLAGFVSTTEATIQNAVAASITALAIGESSYLNRLWSPANLTGYAAYQSSGQSQSALQLLSNTYNLTAIYQARSDMVTTTTYAAGATVIHVENVMDFAEYQKIGIELTDGSVWLTTISAAIAGNNITFANAIPAGKTVALGAQVYVAGDLSAAFIEGFAGTAANINVITP